MDTRPSARGNPITPQSEAAASKRCPVCGAALEVTHMVLGRMRTHPCACRCEIARFEQDRARKAKS